MTLLSARNLTATRIGRCLFHIILEHRKSHLDTWKAHQYAGYLRVLGFKKSSGRLWKAIDPTFRDCMITRTSEVSGRLSEIGMHLMKLNSMHPGFIGRYSEIVP